MRNVIAIAGTLLLAASCVRACGLCGGFKGNPLGLLHPRAIEIAVATRSAIDARLLAEVPAENPTGGWNRREKPSARKAAEHFAESIRAADGEGLSVHILLVDTEESFLIHVRPGGVLIETGSAGRADAVLATTNAALWGLANGQVTSVQALDRTLIVIDGERDRLRRLLDRAAVKRAGRR